MSNNTKNKRRVASDVDNALLDYQDAAEMASTHRYRCRDCGLPFETLEEHDLHYREVHEQVETYPLAGMTM